MSVQNLTILLMVSVQVDGKRAGPDYIVDGERAGPDYTVDDERACLCVGCLTSQQHASVSQGRICSDNFTTCQTIMIIIIMIYFYSAFPC